jgi:hypothetical protein
MFVLVGLLVLELQKDGQYLETEVQQVTVSLY